MSTLKVTNIESPSGGGVNAKITDINGGQLSNRNLVINGAMQVAQRSTSETGISSDGYKTVDRMKLSYTSIPTARFTHEQSTDAPDGFSYSVKTTTTTAEGSVGSLDGFRPIEYVIEGQDLQHLAYGTSSAKSLTLSFHVKSSVTGTYTIAFYRDESTDRLITATYTINSASTWEYKTITIPGDTGASITSDNASRFVIFFHAGAGSGYKGTDSSGSWGNYSNAGFANGMTVDLQNTLNATWQATGIQLEVGDVATAFEQRSYGDELARCERYCQVFEYTGQYKLICQGIIESGATIESLFTLRRTMRAFPSCTLSNIANFRLNDFRGNDEDADAFIGVSEGSLSNIRLKFRKPTSNMDTGRAGYVNTATSSGATMTFSAEL